MNIMQYSLFTNYHNSYQAREFIETTFIILASWSKTSNLRANIMANVKNVYFIAKYYHAFYYLFNWNEVKITGQALVGTVPKLTFLHSSDFPQFRLFTLCFNIGLNVTCSYGNYWCCMQIVVIFSQKAIINVYLV